MLDRRLVLVGALLPACVRARDCGTEIRARAKVIIHCQPEIQIDS